jgi:hypothetical protein
MCITRRNFFRNVAADAAVTRVFATLVDPAFSELLPSFSASEPGGPIILGRNKNALT